jgi:hypothetical protein
MRWPVVFALFACLPVGCSKQTKPSPPAENNPPEILSIETLPERVLAAQRIFVSCKARDRDKEFMKFWWDATAGTFPSGNVLSTVTWISPPRLGPQNLRVWVTDFEDTTSGTLPIGVARVLPPDSTWFSNGANLIAVGWKPTTDAVVEHWTGYELYAAHHSLADAPPETLARYLRTPEPLTRLEFRLLSVMPGEKLFIHLRSRRDYEGVTERSDSGPEVDTAARLDGFGTASLYEVSSRRGPKGVHLPGGSVEPLDPGQTGRIDLYLGTSGATDGPGELRIKSPSLLAYRDPAWAGRVTGIQILGTDWDVPVPGESPLLPEVPLVDKTIYALYTADGHYAKFRVLEVRGSSPERRIEFQWAWQPLPGYPRF